MRAFLDQLNQSAAHSSDAVASDFQFHLQIAEATGNRYFTDIMSPPGHYADSTQPGELGAPGPMTTSSTTKPVWAANTSRSAGHRPPGPGYRRALPCACI